MIDIDSPGVVHLAEAVLTEWIMGADPMSGEWWVMWCTLAHVNPKTLARDAEAARRANPRLLCGHFNTPDNLYQRYGRDYCRKCQSERRRAFFENQERI